jgi:mRNA-degrading endonuclease toxin of MazEF toxin-antitoxin module
MTIIDPHPRRTHIYWVRVPDEPRGKRRPALVVSPDIRNRLANDAIVVPISSVLREAPRNVRLRSREGGRGSTMTQAMSSVGNCR